MSDVRNETSCSSAAFTTTFRTRSSALAALRTSDVTVAAGATLWYANASNQTYAGGGPLRILAGFHSESDADRLRRGA